MIDGDSPLLPGVPLARRLRRAIALSFAIVLLPATSHAVVLTLLESTANVSGTITSPFGNWSDSAQSMDLAPSIQVMQSFGGGIGANSFVIASHDSGLARLVIESGFTAGSGGQSSDSAIDYDFELRFTLDGPAAFTFQNNNSTGSFPRAFAPTAGTSASLVYELVEEGGGTIFTFAAPEVAVAGVYALGVIPAGTYRWTGVGSATANGNPCCGAQSANITGNVRLSFEDAPPTPVPALRGAGLALLVVSLVGFALFRATAENSLLESRE